VKLLFARGELLFARGELLFARGVNPLPLATTGLAAPLKGEEKYRKDFLKGIVNKYNQTI
jgi:hypothetical protein